ncbi:carbamoyl phosphate synthase small subunit [Selenomonadales bacterium OttesenSCG-928-I06]|nr:carbamoyl phosphate synthase small subunit [Selenomonadales bacterium OttesenSCG-928-I06]
MRGKLILEDGTCFEGTLLNEAQVVGEVVCNIGVVGYQEVITDPTNCNNIVVFTYPLIGNYGVAEKFNESEESYPAGIVIGELCEVPNNWQMEMKFKDYLVKKNILCLYDVDTRALTKHVREKGDMQGVIVPEKTNENTIKELLTIELSNHSIKKVTSSKNSRFPQKGPHIVVIDLGIKNSVLQSLVDFGFNITVVPAFTNTQEILKLKPDGIFLSHGPENPNDSLELLDIAKQLIASGKPIFGLGVGLLTISLAFEIVAYKMKFGHRSGSHPVRDLITGRIYNTVQNHGYAIDENSINKGEIIITHRSANDNTIEGFKHKTKPIYLMHFYPETEPGPDDNSYLLKEFFKAVKKEAKKNGRGNL